MCSALKPSSLLMHSPLNQTKPQSTVPNSLMFSNCGGLLPLLCLIGSTLSPPASPRGKDGEESQVRGKLVNFFISSSAAIAVEVVMCALRAHLRWSLDKAGLKRADVCCVLKQCLLFLPPVWSRSWFVGCGVKQQGTDPG